MKTHDENNHRVLVVDDDPNIRKTLSDILRVKGYEVITAENGVAGIAEAAKAFINIALIDLKLPDMTGIEVMEHIKAGTPLTEAIILTGHASMDTAIEATGKGAFSYLLKPYEIEDLLLHIHHAIDRQQAQEVIGRLASYPRMSPDPIVEVNASGNITYLNPAAERLFPDMGSSGWEHPLLNGLADMMANIQQGGRQEDVHNVDLGNAIYERRTYFVPENNLIRITALDITKRKQSEKALHDSELRYRRLFEASTDGILILDSATGHILDVNPSLINLLGYRRDECIGKHLSELGAFNDIVTGKVAFNELQSSEYLHYDDLPIRTSDGRDIVVEFISHAYPINGDKVIQCSIRNITERKAAEERIKLLAYYDTLTGLPNRDLIRDRIMAAAAASHRRHTKFAVLFLDIDRFKAVNDSFGLHVGDLLLKGIADRIKDCIREEDSAARVGSDEFLILLQDISEAGGVETVVRRILDSMPDVFRIKDHQLIVTCCLGVSIYPEHGSDADTLIKNADAAMHSAKVEGRGTFRIFTSDMNEMAARNLTMEYELRQALKNDEFVLHYQPQQDLATDMIIGFEALVRWMHPVHGMLSPDQFIPVAEESGLVAFIGEQVLRKACFQNKQWQAQGLPQVPVAVNVSAIQFLQGGFLASITQALFDSGLEPRFLELELTESLLLSDVETVIEMLNKLQKIGLKLLIDDFGTGYSSLSYLKRFPVYKLKIDQSFVRELPTDTDSASIVAAIIGIATSLHMKVIAEGVETEEQLAFLQARGCDEIQGYLYGKPLPPENAAEFLKANDSY